MSYWAVARLEPNRERLAIHCLTLAGYPTYLPRLREQRIRHGRRIEVRSALFPGYAFVSITLQWRAARWSVGVTGLIMNGAGPARVADHIIDEIRSREVRGLIELPRRELVPGDAIRISRGPLVGQLGLFQGMRGSERVLVLLQMLGHVTLSREDVEPV